tara:strand:- start:221 stop:382 length:162 start_codon:yes stop_codon:yes gene_type:complete
MMYVSFWLRNALPDQLNNKTGLQKANSKEIFLDWHHVYWEIDSSQLDVNVSRS